MKILYINDEEKLAERFVEDASKLKPHWQIETCHSGQTAQDILRNHHYQFIVTDMELGDMNAAQLLSWYEQQRKNSPTKDCYKGAVINSSFKPETWEQVVITPGDERQESHTQRLLRQLGTSMMILSESKIFAFEKLTGNETKEQLRTFRTSHSRQAEFDAIESLFKELNASRERTHR